MARFENNEAFFKAIDGTCHQLQEIGMVREASRASYLLHNVTWTTTSEFFRELETTFKDLVSGSEAARIPPRLRVEIGDYIKALEDAR